MGGERKGSDIRPVSSIWRSPELLQPGVAERLLQLPRAAPRRLIMRLRDSVPRIKRPRPRPVRLVLLEIPRAEARGTSPRPRPASALDVGKHAVCKLDQTVCGYTAHVSDVGFVRGGVRRPFLIVVFIFDRHAG